jgi:hypothetical protein
MGYLNPLCYDRLECFRLASNAFLLSFQQYLGKKVITLFFSSISWQNEKQTFFLYVFSIGYGNLASFFVPLFF